MHIDLQEQSDSDVLTLQDVCKWQIEFQKFVTWEDLDRNGERCSFCGCTVHALGHLVRTHVLQLSIQSQTQLDVLEASKDPRRRIRGHLC